MGFVKGAALAAAVAVLAVVCCLPPLSSVIHHHYTAVFPPARAAKVDGVMQGMVGAFAIRTGLDLGLFELLKAGPMPLDRIAGELKASKRGTEVLLNALAVLDFVSASATGEYALTAPSLHHLVKGREPYFGDMIELFTSPQMLDVLRLLPASVVAGGSTAPVHAELLDNPFWTYFAHHTTAMSRPHARKAAAHAAPAADAARAAGKELRVLDVAAGSGAYGTAFLKTYPHARVSFQDGPAVLDATRENVGDELGPGALARSRFLPGDFFTRDLEGPYDVVVASHFHHHFNESRCVELTARLHAVLAPGGTLLVHEFVGGEGPPSLWERNPFPRLFSLNMLAWTHSGAAHPESLYRRVLAAAGPWAGVEFRSAFPAPSTFILATRAA